MRRIAGLIFCALSVSLTVSAACEHGCEGNCEHEGLQLRARIGYNIGGTAPLGMPATIRSLEAYHLTPSFMAGADAMLPLGNRWGIQAGLHVENKGMDGEVTTKGYRMKLKMDEDEMEGLYTGHVRQKVRQWMFTLPVQATCRLGSTVMLKAGPYVSLLFSKDFSGYASDGYLRKDDPTGPKVVMGSTEDQWATYEFPDDMRRWQFGVAVGADWQLLQRFGLSLDLSWGLTGLMKSDFKTVEQTLYPIYGTRGIFYRIR